MVLSASLYPCTKTQTITKHLGTGTNAGSQPNCGTRERVLAKYADKHDTHGRLARRQARDHQRILLPCPLRGRNLPPKHDIFLCDSKRTQTLDSQLDSRALTLRTTWITMRFN